MKAETMIEEDGEANNPLEESLRSIVSSRLPLFFDVEQGIYVQRKGAAQPAIFINSLPNDGISALTRATNTDAMPWLPCHAMPHLTSFTTH